MNKIAFRPDFQQFCDEYEYYTEKGNYSTTAETLFRYIAQNTDFTEEHTALADSLIELDILCHCVDMGCEWHTEYKVYRSVPRKADKVLVVRDVNGVAYVLRTGKDEFFRNCTRIKEVLEKINRLNIVLTDVESFIEADFEDYNKYLSSLNYEFERLYLSGKTPQLNLLTDRMMLTKIRNCNAGWENVTLAPDGKFYICPAFYQGETKTVIEDKASSIGDLQNGLNIKNPQLYHLSHAPLCRNCDAYQCKRCIWLNRKATLEINTPSHEQCVVSHIERNVSAKLLTNIRQHGIFMPEVEIKEITYLDPFEVRKEW